MGQALTESAFTKRWWRISLDTDWQVGSPMTWDNNGIVIADPEQVVLEFEPYTRLSYSWHSFTPAWNERVQLSAESFNQIAKERRSRVSFDLEALGEMVKLTVVQRKP